MSWASTPAKIWRVNSTMPYHLSSKAQLDKARSAARVPIVYLQGDLQDLKSVLDPAQLGTFDAVFSSATFHWCKRDPGGVIESAKSLLKPGGRLAFEFGGFGNTLVLSTSPHRSLFNHAQGRRPFSDSPGVEKAGHRSCAPRSVVFPYC